MNDGTPRAIGPIADQALAWVAGIRRENAKMMRSLGVPLIDPDDLRRIELCAQAAREAAMFHDLYGMETDATAPEVQGQRGAPGGVPETPEGREGRYCRGCGQ